MPKRTRQSRKKASITRRQGFRSRSKKVISRRRKRGRKIIGLS